MIPCSLFDILKPYLKYSAKKYENIVFKLRKIEEPAGNAPDRLFLLKTVP